MKAGPRQSQFEPSEGNVSKFNDVHGVDEAKDVCIPISSCITLFRLYFG